MHAFIQISLHIYMSAQPYKEKETNTLAKNKTNKNTKNKRKNKKEEDKSKKDKFDATLQGICPQYKERAKKLLREGKIIPVLWYCYERHRLILEW